ncbi:MAG TPA: heme-binding domain-containing protein [Actinomycetota bacterium]|nr:heme-binding domain-containing protein [Actinomycetota bacterium]
MKHRLVRLVLIGAIVFVVIQFVPYGRAHDNPPVTEPIEWEVARTEQLFDDACADCHSNETEWPWYSNVAPQSWLVQRDVDAGREELNLSELDREQDEIKDLIEVIADDEMPPLRYTFLHPEARLSEAEKQALIDGIARTFGGDVDQD